MKKYTLKIWPYVACVLAGIILYYIGIFLNSNLQGLFSNIAAAFFSIPLLFLIYDLAQRFSNKQLNEKIYDYAKMLIDMEVLVIISQLLKRVYPNEKYDTSFEDISKILGLSITEFKSQIASFEYLGFQVLKNWSMSKANIHDILKNPFILRSLNDEQIISIIDILTSIYMFEDIQTQPYLYEISEKLDARYRIQSGLDINERNIEYPERYLLLKNIGEDKCVVTDFGDFAVNQKSNLLKICKMTPGFIDCYSKEFFGIVDSIKIWLSVTDNLLFLDGTMTNCLRYERPINDEKHA
jgi:hypothetical protein